MIFIDNNYLTIEKNLENNLSGCTHYILTFLKTGTYNINIYKYITGGNQGYFSCVLNGTELMPKTYAGTHEINNNYDICEGDKIYFYVGKDPDHSHRPHGSFAISKL